MGRETDVQNANDENDDDDNGNEEEENDNAGDSRMGRTIRNLTNNERRVLLRHIPAGNSTMNNMAIFANPDDWFKHNNNVSIQQSPSTNIIIENQNHEPSDN